jgi:hypothetical protein
MSIVVGDGSRAIASVRDGVDRSIERLIIGPLLDSMVACTPRADACTGAGQMTRTMNEVSSRPTACEEDGTENKGSQFGYADCYI